MTEALDEEERCSESHKRKGNGKEEENGRERVEGRGERKFFALFFFCFRGRRGSSFAAIQSSRRGKHGVQRRRRHSCFLGVGRERQSILY